MVLAWMAVPLEKRSHHVFERESSEGVSAMQCEQVRRRPLGDMHIAVPWVDMGG